jgi:hypothetical protein
LLCQLRGPLPDGCPTVEQICFCPGIIGAKQAEKLAYSCIRKKTGMSGRSRPQYMAGLNAAASMDHHAAAALTIQGPNGTETAKVTGDAVTDKVLRLTHDASGSL